MSNAARMIPAAVALLLAGLGTDASAQTGASRCVGTAQIVRAQSSGVRTTAVNFNTDIFGNPDPTGYFDPQPLIATTITTTAASTCLIVHFSALAEPQDNHVMFQVRANGTPMQGHAIFPYSVPTVQAPVVWDPEETDKNLTRMVASPLLHRRGSRDAQDRRALRGLLRADQRRERDRLGPQCRADAPVLAAHRGGPTIGGFGCTPMP
jgi:hypothetical protein